MYANDGFWFTFNLSGRKQFVSINVLDSNLNFFYGVP